MRPMPPRPRSSAPALLGCGRTTIAWEAIFFPHPALTPASLLGGRRQRCSVFAALNEIIRRNKRTASQTQTKGRKGKNTPKRCGIAPWTQQLTQQFGRVGSRMRPIVPSGYALSRVRGPCQGACITTQGVCKLCRAAAVDAIFWVLAVNLSG